MTRSDDDAEWSCLEQVCLYTAGRAPIDGVISPLKQNGFSFGKLLEQAVRHKVHLVTADALGQRECAAFVPEKWRWVLSAMLAQNRLRCRALTKHAAELTAALVASGVPVAGRKGLSLEPWVYGNRGARWLSDLDFLVRLEDRRVVEEVAKALGYRTGVLDRARGEVVSHDRKYLLTLATSPDHLPRCGKLVDEEGLDYLDVDWATSFTWWKGDYELDLAPALAGIVPAAPGGVPRLPPRYDLLDVTLHFFREAYFESTALSKPDHLIGFLDILMLLKSYPELRGGGFGSFVREIGAEQPCAWVFTHLDRSLGTTVVQEVGLAGVASEDFLSSWRRSGGALARWAGQMRERMRAVDRRSFFLGGAPA